MLRLEKKYLVPNYLMNDLRKRIRPFVRPDLYALSGNNEGIPEYTVRSIYFDSSNLDCYTEKKEGVLLRKKFRIRGYGDSEIGQNVIFEIKRKIENRVKKHRAPVKLSDMESLLYSGNVEKYVLNENGNKNSIDDARRFLFHVKKNKFEPTSQIVYEREPYHGKFDDGVRITFDKNIRSLNYPGINELYSNSNQSYLFKNHFILEIKYFTYIMPVWAKSLIQEFRLRNEALSKYVIGFDACMKNGNRKKC